MGQKDVVKGNMDMNEKSQSYFKLKRAFKIDYKRNSIIAKFISNFFDCLKMSLSFFNFSKEDKTIGSR